MKAAPFHTRYRITGKLTTLTPLHIGDGNVKAPLVPPVERSAARQEKSTSPASVYTDHQGKACIPGSSLKGPLRALARKLLDEDTVRKFFGHEDATATSASVGRITCCTAFHHSGCEEKTYTAKSNSDLQRPYWDSQRRTAVAMHLSMDRRTRTADDQKLYAVEYVPPGEPFFWELFTEGLSEDDVCKLLRLLDELSTGHITLGAGDSSGWGHVRWERKMIETFGQTELEPWKKDCTQPLPWREIKLSPWQMEPTQSSEQLLSIQLELQMHSPWLTRDPRQKKRKESEENQAARIDIPDAVPLRNHAGKPYLPASSVRGSLRSQAERILRTVGLPCPDHPNEEKPDQPSLAAHLFGHTHWKSPLTLTDATPLEMPTTHSQEYVAIDRFTGGAAEGAKFKSEVVDPSTLVLTLSLDLSRELTDKTPFAKSAALGLLALVLRDLAEGDIPLGSGAAKGHGCCTAHITIAGSSPWYEHHALKEGLSAFDSLLQLTSQS